jgi:hypothetical protein
MTTNPKRELKVVHLSVFDCIVAIRKATSTLGCRDEAGEIQAMEAALASPAQQLAQGRIVSLNHRGESALERRASTQQPPATVPEEPSADTEESLSTRELADRWPGGVTRRVKGAADET